MGIIFKKPQGGSGSGGVNVGIIKDQFLATEGQTTFTIQNIITENDLLMVFRNNLYLEKNINYSVSEDSASKSTTITIPTLKLNEIVSWVLIKVGNTPITPEQKKAICGTFKCGDLLVGQGLDANVMFELIKDEESSLSEDFLKSFC